MSLEPHGELIPVGGGDPIPLIRETLTVGRRESCDICMRLPNVSGLHCELSFRDGFWWISDLGSTNGIKVNGVRVPRKLLQPQDIITIAKRRFTIEYTVPVGKRAMEEMMEDNPMSQSLLEKAGLLRPRRDPLDGIRRKVYDPDRFLLDEDEDEEER
ncbi:MAG: FHA domain-containing protein [Gemmataceae bacterium]|nr:FHA domain-containing protein [Gemmataceae bacterium]